MAECYVCNDDEKDEALLSNVCECKNIRIHPSCQLRLVRECPSGATCTICKQPYTNLVVAEAPNTRRRRLLLARRLARTASCASMLFVAYNTLVFITSATSCHDLPCPECDKTAARDLPSSTFDHGAPLNYAAMDGGWRSSNNGSATTRICFTTFPNITSIELLAFVAACLFLVGWANLIRSIEQRIAVEPITRTTVAERTAREGPAEV